jgi:hypothetical protein
VAAALKGNKITMHAYAIGLALVAGAVGAALYAYGKLPRVQAILFALAAFGAAVGITEWTDALAGLVHTTGGLTALAAVMLVSAIGFWFEVIHKHKHHKIRTPVMSAVFATALVLSIGSVSALGSRGLLSPAKASAAFGNTVARIHSGQAAKAAMAMPAGHRNMVLIIGAAVAAGLIILAARLERRGGRGRSAASAGRSGAVAASPARRALPAGRRR